MLKFTGSAICRECRESKPDSEFLVRSGTRIFVCTACRAKQAARGPVPPSVARRTAPPPPAEKACKRCGQVRPNNFQFFSPVGNGRGEGMRPGGVCKECFSRSMKLMHARHRAEALDYEAFKRGEVTEADLVVRRELRLAEDEAARVKRLQAQLKEFEAAVAQTRAELAALLAGKPDAPTH